MNGGIRLLSLSLLILTLCSCVSVSTLKKGDCQNANWQEVGILDGKQGSNSQKILKHIKTCQGKSVPDKALWETGRANWFKTLLHQIKRLPFRSYGLRIKSCV